MSPEARAGGPLSRVRNGDRIRIRIDTRALEGSVDGRRGRRAAEFAARPPNPQLVSDPRVPADTSPLGRAAARRSAAYVGRLRLRCRPH